MFLLKRLTVWLLEQLPEAFLLGCALTALLFRVASFRREAFPTEVKGLLQVVCVYGLTVATILFMHGYYVSKALFGVLLRSKRPWLYPTIAAALLVIHTRIVFLRFKQDFTPEARAMEIPFALVGAGIAFACAFAGGWVLRKWIHVGSAPTPYLSAMAITLLVFILANAAHYLRPMIGDESFRAYGLPFTFYREGGFVNGWQWRSGTLVWLGILADVLLLTVVITVLGKAWQRFTVSRAQ